MKQSGKHDLLLVVAADYLRLGSNGKVSAEIGGAFEAGLSGPKEREESIEEIGQFEVLRGSVMAMVGCLRGWTVSLLLAEMSLAGLSWQVASAPLVLASLPRYSFFSLFHSSFILLISVLQLPCNGQQDSYTKA